MAAPSQHPVGRRLGKPNPRAACPRRIELPISEVELRSKATVAGQSLTFTAVPPSTGARIGIDRDSDGSRDGDDNCSSRANADQRDTNGDGFGNLCDPDLNNDGIVNLLDLRLMRARLGTSDADADLTGDGIVNFEDLALLRAAFLSRPGPSALAR